MEGTFLRTSGNTYTKTTKHHRLATLHQANQIPRERNRGRREDLPASPDHFDCSTSQPLSCHWGGAYSQLLQFVLGLVQNFSQCPDGFEDFFSVRAKFRVL